MSLKDLLTDYRRFDLETLYNTFIGLPSRQQAMALGGAGFGLLLVLVMPFVIASSYVGGLEDEIAAAHESMDKAVHQINQYETLRHTFASYEQYFHGQSGDSVVPAIQRVATDIGVPISPPPAERGRESFDIYEEEKASFNIKGVSLEQLVKLLQALESSSQRVMRVREIAVAPVYGNRSLLNAEVKEVAAYRLVAEEKAKPEKPGAGKK